MTESIETLRAQLQQLEALHKSGTLAKKAYDAARAPLERQLLDRVLAGPEPAGAAGATAARDAPAMLAMPATPAAAIAPRLPRRLVLTLSAVVLVLAAAGYAWTGSPSLIAGVPPVAPAQADAPHEMSGAQFAAAVDRLADKLKEQPDNAEGWTMLARSYVQLGRFPDALPAFAKAVALRGDDASLLSDYADAMAVANNRTLAGEPTKLIQRALKADPDNLKALALAGTAAFDLKDYAGAVRHWEKLAKAAPPGSPFTGQLNESIAEARKLAGMPVAAPPSFAPPAQEAPTPATAMATTGGATVRGTVRLAPAVAKLASPQDTVFLYARAAEGSRMPLAILRKQVKDLPFEFTLDDSMAMTPAMKMSLFPKIVVDARVSKSGQAQAGAGDLTGRSPPIDHNASGVVVEIADVVK